MSLSLEHILTWFEASFKDKKILLPDIDDERMFLAVSKLLSAGEGPIIYGKKYELERYYDLIQQGLDFVQVPDDEQNIVVAAQDLAEWKWDGFLWGNISTTTDVARALIKNIGTEPSIGRASSHFLFGKEWKEPFLLSDGGFQIDPSAQQLAEIALLTAKRAQQYGLTPRVAFLSFSTSGSGGEHPHVLKIQEATTHGRKLFQEHDLWDIEIEWELQFDAAFIPEILRKKSPNSSLTGPANVFIFPDLNSANIAYKIIERLAGYTALWPILQGFSKPANDLSRGCSVEDIVQMYYVTKNTES